MMRKLVSRRWAIATLLASLLWTGIGLAQAVPGFPQVPDPALTPGAWHDPPTPLAVLCKPGYTKTVRNVPNEEKLQVYKEYGLDPKTNQGNFEVDHLVSLEIDGTNAVQNLWPQSYITQPMNAHRKDVLENTLKRLVCSGTLPLAQAQHEIVADWPAAYRKYVLHSPS